MKVLVTGGTGYVGSHAVLALLAAGYQPRLLVRRPKRLATTLGAVGVDIDSLDIAEGDMTDRDAVAAAVTGIDAVIHAAAVVAVLDQKEAQRSVEINLLGTRTVVDAATAAGCDPIVYVSSVAALFSPRHEVIRADLPPVIDAASPYTRSKAIAEQFARDRQDEGAPVVIVYPGGVCGPPIGEVFGDAAAGFESMLKTGFLPMAQGGIGIIDARDLAAVLVAALSPGKGPRRFMAGGQLVTLPEIGAIIRAGTGRRFPVLRVPGGVFRGLGHAIDGIRHVIPFDSVYTAEAMKLLTLARPTNDAAVHTELGITYRDPAESLLASVKGLYDAGRLSARQVGRLSGQS